MEEIQKELMAEGNLYSNVGTLIKECLFKIMPLKMRFDDNISLLGLI